MEQIIEVTFNQGGIRGGITGLTPGQVRKVARKLRPTPSYSGTLTVKSTEDGLYQRSIGGGLLSLAEWILIS